MNASAEKQEQQKHTALGSPFDQDFRQK